MTLFHEEPPLRDQDGDGGDQRLHAGARRQYFVRLLGCIHAVLVSSLGKIRRGRCGPRLPYVSLTGVEWRGLE